MSNQGIGSKGGSLCDDAIHHQIIMKHQISPRRTREDLPQAALSVELGWPQQRLSAIETGARRIDVMEYLQLTASLDLSPAAAIEMAIQATDEQG